MQRFPVVAIGTAGYAGTIGQVLIIRELLVLFYGNELTTGLVLAAWLFSIAIGSGIGARWGKALKSDHLASCLILFAWLLPATLLFIRSVRIIWNIPFGEALPLHVILMVCIASTSAFCMVSGFLFSLAWHVFLQCDASGSKTPVVIYLGEALGASTGGLIFHFVLLPNVSMLGSAIMTSGIILILVAIYVHFWKRIMTFLSFFWIISVLMIGSGTIFHQDLDRWSRKWQWGDNLVAVKDTPFSNLALIHRENQWTLFSNGLWCFTVPDDQHAEISVHPVLLHHPEPKSVLLIGGGASGLVNEVLKYSSVKRIHVVESDPELISFARQYMPETLQSLDDSRVMLIHEDAGLFIRQSPITYDVILMNMADPANAQLNRFYTVEFFDRIQTHLNPGGIFSFDAAASMNMLGAAQIYYLQSVFVTVRTVFSYIAIFPGERARFFATDASDGLVLDPAEFARRLVERNLNLRFVNDIYFLDALNPMRMDYFYAILSKDPSEGRLRANRNFSPTCYFTNMVLWGAQMNESVKVLLMRLGKIPEKWFWAGWIIMIVMGIGWMKNRSRRSGIGVCVAVVGGALIVLQIVLLLGFQILAGFMYKQLALIISFFMAGLAVGSAIIAGIDPAIHKLRLMSVQGLLGLHTIVTIVMLYGIQSGQFHYSAIPWIFSILALTAGILGGLHFSLAVHDFSSSHVPGVKVGGSLYALDLLGASAGAFLSTLFLLPVYGVATTAGSSVMLVFATMVLLRNRPQSL